MSSVLIGSKFHSTCTTEEKLRIRMIKKKKDSFIKQILIKLIKWSYVNKYIKNLKRKKKLNKGYCFWTYLSQNNVSQFPKKKKKKINIQFQIWERFLKDHLLHHKTMKIPHTQIDLYLFLICTLEGQSKCHLFFLFLSPSSISLSIVSRLHTHTHTFLTRSLFCPSALYHNIVFA